MAGLIVVQYDSCKSTPILPLIAYALLSIHVLISSICGVWNEWCIKNLGVSMHIQNMILYIVGTMLNFALYFILPPSLYGLEERVGFFEGYDGSAMLVVFMNSIIGIVLVAVYKYADVIVKTFAFACSTSILYAINVIFFGFKWNAVIGSVCFFV